MKISGYEIISCPYCSQLYRNQIIASYNTFDSSYFSDGYLEGPFIPNMPSIIKCVDKNCGKFFNIQETKIMAKVDYQKYVTSEWKHAFYLAGYKIGIKELEEALAIGFCKDEQDEINVRIRLLRRYNDFFRQDKNYKFPSEKKEAFLRNIDRLIELHENESTTGAKLFLAELYREKSDLDLCMEILNGITNENEDEKTIKEKIYSQAKIKDDKVFNVKVIVIKKEFRCNNCGDSFILFDLSKMNNSLNYKYYRCRIENRVFNAASKENNPGSYYRLTRLQKLFRIKKPYQDTIPRKNIVCPTCNGTDLEIFNPENQNCIKCGHGNYDVVKWFN